MNGQEKSPGQAPQGSTDGTADTTTEGSFSHAANQRNGNGNSYGSTPLNRVLALLNGCQQSSTGFTALCPAHDDTNSSLSISTADDGKVLLYCHAGCTVHSIVARLGLTLGDLFPPQSHGPRIVATYDYPNEHGTLLFQAVRFDPKNFRQRRPDGNGGWIWNLKDTRRVLYCLPELATAGTVYLVEGEKDADAVRKLGLVATCNPMGAGKWRDEYSQYLADKHVVILPDNDEPGEQHAQQVTHSVCPVAASVKVVPLPDLPPKGDVSDWLHAGHTKEELLALIEATPVWAEEEDTAWEASEQEEMGEAEAPAKKPRSARPTIQITTDITRVVDAAEAAVLTLPHGPHLFQRINQLCFVTHSAIPPKWLKRPVGAPTISPCSPAQLRERMSQAADWMKWDARSEAWTAALPPEWAVKTLHERREWGFPILADVIAAPTLREDGEIISAPGYDPDTGLFLDTQGVTFPPIPPQPTIDDAVNAVAALTEPFADFPFAGPYGMSAALSGILSLVARPAINGCVPLFAVDSTTRGTGKGLLIDVGSTIATGRLAPRWAQTRDEEEDRKALLTIGMEGDACVHIDNLTHPLGSGPLDSALTAGVIKGRLLGLNKSAEAPMNCVFFASGNNISFVGDMARRVVPIQLESLEEHPENREDFQQPRLLEWVRQERPRLVVEALTLLRAYFVAGCPKQRLSAYGSFEAWSDLIRSALVWAGCADPCEGRALLEAASDPGYEHLARLLHCWAACYENKAVTLSSVIGDVGLRKAEVAPNEWNELGEALAAFDPRFDGKRWDVKRIGLGLRAIKGRVISHYRLIQVGQAHKGVVLWALQQV